MKKSTFSLVVVAVVLLCTLAGCGLSIKDTSGIKVYLQEQGRSEIMAIDIKSKNPDKNSPTYKNAEKLFNQAAGDGNGWTKGIIFDAKAKREVSISVQDYRDSAAGKSIAAFLSLKPQEAFDPVVWGAVVKFAVDVIDLIQKQNDKKVEAAVQAMEGEFSKARWTTFELTTSQWVNEKYKLSGPEK